MAERFELVKKGYEPDAVDRYIAALEAQVASYRGKDKAITNAIISAQQAADTIITNAKSQARLIRENTAKQLGDITLSLNTQRSMLSDFASEYGMVVSKYLRVVDNSDFMGITEKIDALESYLSDFSDEVAEDLEIEKRLEATEAEALLTSKEL
ncbi:MAG: DivIVA domain-containing protein [Clostridiales bacterium]|jgi:cell division septum initiation protein DivIVA|nr:DivIVA domain-containing protein [Clostridiales bacterium]